MAGNGIVAATDATLTIAPPVPADPPGRIARKACFMPRLTPTTLTSSILRRSSASASITSAEISMPALFTRMSKPPSTSTVLLTADSQSASCVTSRCTKPVLAPVAPIFSAVVRPRSSRMSPMTTPAPAAPSDSAMPAPMPRAPPVTRALRPDKSKLLTMNPPIDRPAGRSPQLEPRSAPRLICPSVRAECSSMRTPHVRIRTDCGVTQADSANGQRTYRNTLGNGGPGRE